MFQSLIKHLFLPLSCREFDRYFYTINFEYSVLIFVNVTVFLKMVTFGGSNFVGSINFSVALKRFLGSQTELFNTCVK